MRDRLTWFERVILPFILALILFGVLTATSAAQSPRELEREIERLQQEVIILRTMITANAVEDARARQDGFTRLSVLEDRVNGLRETARENRQLFYGTLATIIGNIFLSLLTFNRVRQKV